MERRDTVGGEDTAGLEDKDTVGCEDSGGGDGSLALSLLRAMMAARTVQEGLQARRRS